MGLVVVEPKPRFCREEPVEPLVDDKGVAEFPLTRLEGDDGAE